MLGQVRLRQVQQLKEKAAQEGEAGGGSVCGQVRLRQVQQLKEKAAQAGEARGLCTQRLCAHVDGATAHLPGT